MKLEGPILETLTQRLAQCPPEFLAEPEIGTRAGERPNTPGTAQPHISVAAVVADLAAELGGATLSRNDLAPFLANVQDPFRDGKHRNYLSLVLIACWLFHDSWFLQRTPAFSGPVLKFLAHDLGPLAEVVSAHQFVTDPDHREELARLALNALGMRPAGETIEQAQDRLTTLDSLERRRVLNLARGAEKRARQVLEAMAAKAAQEAAAKWNRE